MKTENEEQEIENNQEQNEENQNNDLEENQKENSIENEEDNKEEDPLEIIQEKEKKYKAQIEQLSSELEIEKKLNQSIKRKPEEEEIIEKLKSKLNEKQTRCLKLKTTNERQRQAIDQLTKELENSYKKNMREKNDSDISKYKEEPVNIILKIKEQDLNKAILQLESLKKENQNMKDALEKSGEYNQLVNLEDNSTEMKKKINQLNIEIKKINIELQKHTNCVQEEDDYKNAEKRLRDDIKDAIDKRVELFKEVTEYKNQIYALNKGEEKKNEDNKINTENNELNKNDNDENNENDDNENLAYMETEEKDKNLAKKNLKVKKRINKKYKNNESYLNNNKNDKTDKNDKNDLYKSLELKKYKKADYKNINSVLKPDLTSSILTEEFKKKLYEIMNSEDDTKILIQKIKEVENKREKIEKKNKTDINNLNQEYIDLMSQHDAIEIKRRKLETNNKVLKLQMNEHINKQKKNQKKVIDNQNQLDFLQNKTKEKDQEIKLLINQLNTLRKMVAYGTVHDPNDNLINDYIKKLSTENETLKYKKMIEKAKSNNQIQNDNIRNEVNNNENDNIGKNENNENNENDNNGNIDGENNIGNIIDRKSYDLQPENTGIHTIPGNNGENNQNENNEKKNTDEINLNI